MKANKLSMAVRSFFVFVVAFTIAFANPFAVDKASAGQAVLDEEIFLWDAKVISKTMDTEIAQYSFTSDGSIPYTVDVAVGWLKDPGLYTDAKAKVILEKGSTVIEPTSEWSWTVSEPGTYYIRIMVPADQNLPSGIVKVKPTGYVLVETEGIPQYEFFKVEKKGHNSDKNTYTILAGAAKYQGNGDLGRLFYIKDHYTGQFQRFGEMTSVFTEKDRLSTTGDRGKTYTVYVVNRDIAEDNKGEVPIPIGNGSSSWFKLTAAQEAKLKEISQFEKISTPPPAVGNISKLTNKKGVTVATLTWKAAAKSDGSAPNITKYVVERYNAAGTKCLKKTTVTNLKEPNGAYKFSFTQDFYTPYKGKSLYKVTPYYKYLGKEYKGKAKSITVSSKALSTGTDGNVVKVTNNKSGVMVFPEYGADGIGVFEKKGNNWVMIGKKKAVKANKGFTYFYIEKKNIGKKNLKFKSYVTDGGKTYWSPVSKKTFKQQKNVINIGTPDNTTAYPWLEVTKVRTKIWYEGNNLKVKYRVVNRDGRQKINVQTTVTAENPLTGKFTTVGKSDKKSVTLDYGEQKFVTVTIKNAKKIDLHNNIIR